jgi:hypothetical protein
VCRVWDIAVKTAKTAQCSANIVQCKFRSEKQYGTAYTLKVL